MNQILINPYQEKSFEMHILNKFIIKYCMPLKKSLYIISETYNHSISPMVVVLSNYLSDWKPFRPTGVPEAA